MLSLSKTLNNELQDKERCCLRNDRIWQLGDSPCIYPSHEQADYLVAHPQSGSPWCRQFVFKKLVATLKVRKICWKKFLVMKEV